MQVIIFPNQTTISIIRPMDCGLPIQEIARKDVPFGVPYRIIDAALIPEDRTYRDAWTADFSNQDGTGLGPHRWWIEKFTAEIEQLEALGATPGSTMLTSEIIAIQEKIETLKDEVMKNEGVQL